jgi:glycerol kinase
VSTGELLALDLGTSGVRALRVDAAGRVCARSHRRVSTQFPAPGLVEQDPEELWRASLAVLREAASGAQPDALAGLGIATQRATALAWDSQSGRPLAPAISWQDKRCEPRVEELRASGVPFTSLPSATRFEWWLRGEPAVRSARAKGRLCLGTPDVWLGYRLSGGTSFVTDPGQASCTGLYDLMAGDWSDALCGIFGVPREALPRVTDTARIEGETQAGLLGRPVPLAARAGDQQAACFGQGLAASGDAKLTLGTSAMLDQHTGAQPVAGRGAFPLALWRIGGADSFCAEASVITAGAAVDWLVSLGLLSDPTQLDRVAGSVAGCDGVYFVPALEGLGSPLLDAHARGLVLGLSRGSTAAHLARALVEGIAHRCIDLCEALELDARPLRVDGGLARSDLLLRLLAELSGRPLLRAAEPETTALGAAALAGVAIGCFADATDFARRCAAPQRFEPTGEPAARASARAQWRRALARSRGPATSAMR